MKNSPEEKLIIRRVLIGFGAAFFLITAVVAAGLLFLVHRTNSYLEDLNQYPQNYIVFYQKDRFRIPPKGIISKSDFEQFLAIQEKLEATVEDLIRTGKIKKNPPESEELTQIATLRSAEIRLFKRENYSIKEYKWIAQQILLVFGGLSFRRYQALSNTAPMSSPVHDLEKAISSIPQQNLELFDEYAGQIESFHFLWLTAI